MKNYNYNYNTYTHTTFARLINVFYINGIIVIVVENGYGDPSSNPGRDCLHFS